MIIHLAVIMSPPPPKLSVHFSKQSVHFHFRLLTVPLWEVWKFQHLWSVCTATKLEGTFYPETVDGQGHK